MLDVQELWIQGREPKWLALGLLFKKGILVLRQRRAAGDAKRM
jgi:hypothetical protein